MPRGRLTAADVVRAGAELADEVGYQDLAMGALAQRLGVRAPSLYKHVDGLDDLRRRVAVLAVTELGEAVRAAIQGRAGSDALAAFARAFAAYVTAHPGRYAATIGAEVTGPGDELYDASARVLESMAAILRGYGVDDDEMVHAQRTLRCLFHGLAALQAANGFQWTGDTDESFDWMIGFVDRGLRGEKTTVSG
ncbi:TetR/AcrR family transcriptional regulator [Actinoallomurus rhizosphaericola]|uniref:TetR/AcrR family transcriptional regulator n=1 Tax=Actinoallomurus rhizosphaericola TaxID=2952536 RepID=UPI002090DCAD|nr:TetR/AcrR family transcriptional regulator [Actinoallomurus rhizosphaericola]MCO5994608.1 TetR/AcrR family transcriptional regulator [Actinoallomurus rhizosphaericola]